MKRIQHSRWSKGFSLFEAMIVSVILAILIAVFLPAFQRPRMKASRISCVNNVKQINLAFRIWAGDNNDNNPWLISVTNGGTLEMAGSDIAYSQFIVMSNELSTPKVLLCPADTNRVAATNFTSLRDGNLSYFVGLHAGLPSPPAFSVGDDNFTVNGIKPKSGLLELSTNSTLAWLPTRHIQAGNIGLVDGSVQQVNNKGLQALVQTGTTTNRLAMP